MTISPKGTADHGGALARQLGQRVRAARNRKGMSRRALGATADVSERYLVQLEAGIANPSIGLVGRLADALGVTFADLVAEPASAPSAVIEPQLAAYLAGLSPRAQSEALDLLRQHTPKRRRGVKGIALLGLRGAGKSTLGSALAKRLGLPFLSVTRMIEELAGMSATELFNLGGADSYRRLEIEAVERLANTPGRAIVEAAGGIVANLAALEAIMANYATVWLKASPEDHLERVRLQGDLRPMRDNPQAIENIRALLAQREPDYARADYTVETSHITADEALEKLTLVSHQALNVNDASA